MLETPGENREGAYARKEIALAVKLRERGIAADVGRAARLTLAGRLSRGAWTTRRWRAGSGANRSSSARSVGVCCTR